ncbi:MAG: anaerobic ribonucleoside triphosphate reductase [Thermoguttaceae bacterium]|nr:anaerobic ribonucleoside triphosphate reductase [Thermoguttaceae bacterium]
MNKQAVMGMGTSAQNSQRGFSGNAERAFPFFQFILKRDGRRVPFYPEKIRSAMQKAFQAAEEAVSADELGRLEMRVTQKIQAMGPEAEPGVEEIQDAVEAVLMEAGKVNAARKYVLYRAERTRIRERNTRLMRTYEDLTFKDAKESDIKRENANVNGDTAMGLMLKYGSEGAKQFCLTHILNPAHAQAHEDGDIHIHDMDFYAMTTTCCQIDLLRLFKNGFGTGHGELREPKDIQSYAALACIAIQANQNDQHGGQSIPNFDYALAPGVTRTFQKFFIKNFGKALTLLAEDLPAGLDAEVLCKEILADGFSLKLEENSAFCMELRSRILEKAGDRAAESVSESGLKIGLGSVIEKAQKFALSESLKEVDRATYQAMEALIHNLNTMHSRAGAQTPFSSINYGLDTSPEGRMVTKNVLLAHEAGMGNGETPIFPIHVYRVKEGINTAPGEPNYDLFRLACRVSAKRLFPNFSFQDAPFNLSLYDPKRPETEISYMGCRTRVAANVYDPENAISYSRGNLSFTSINLPRIAIRAKGDQKWFFEELERKLKLCADQLLERFTIQSSKKVRNFPFLMGQGVWLGSEKLGEDDTIGEVLKHGTLSIGFIGLAETLRSLIGVHHGESAEAQELGLKIVGFMRDFMDRKSAEMKLNFTLLATPAEGLSGRFLRMDRRRFGLIPGITDHEYYTNSFHVPVYHTIGAFEKIRLEAPYHALTNAGHITYIELDGDLTQNPKAFEQVIHAMRKAGIGYGAINHPVDRDPVCGFNGVIHDVCPKCGRTEGDVPFERIRRITGYLVGTLDRFNDAKRTEVDERVLHGDSLRDGN